MKTLLLRLAAPLQSWGVNSKFDTRATDHEPTKSAIIGLLAAALGRERTASLDDLAALEFAVRIDQYQSPSRDFQIARHPHLKERSFISHRYYLPDAVFVAGLAGADQKIAELAAALCSPVFPLALGRRSCPPTLPLVLEVSDQSLLAALRAAPWQASQWYRRRQPPQLYLEIVRDASDGEPTTYLSPDHPRTFDPAHRQYDWRRVIRESESAGVAISNPDSKQTISTTHDPFLDLSSSEQPTLENQE